MAKMVHIITPEGREVVSTRAEWNSMPSDWKSLASCFDCKNCTQKKGELADHPAGKPAGRAS